MWVIYLSWLVVKANVPSKETTTTMIAVYLVLRLLSSGEAHAFEQNQVVATVDGDLPPENWTSENVSSPGI